MRRLVANLAFQAPTAARITRSLPRPLAARVRSVASRLVPRNRRVWSLIEQGPARGVWMHLDPRVDGALRSGRVEPRVVDTVSRLLKRGMVFWDVGANAGLYTLIAARIVGGEGVVVALEPDEVVAARLRTNLGRNHLSERVQVLQAAAWSTPGEVGFAASDESQSPGRGTGRVATEKDRLVVTAVTLDGLFSDRAPDIVKIDVEGAELEIFRGARRLIAERRTTWIVEVHGEVVQIELMALLSAAGYVADWVDETHLCARAGRQIGKTNSIMSPADGAL